MKGVGAGSYYLHGYRAIFTVSTEEQPCGIWCLDDLDNGRKTHDLDRGVVAYRVCNISQESSML